MFFSMDLLQMGTREVAPRKHPESEIYRDNQHPSYSVRRHCSQWTGPACPASYTKSWWHLWEPYNDSNCLLKQDKEIQSIKCINSQPASECQDLLLGVHETCAISPFSVICTSLRGNYISRIPLFCHMLRKTPVVWNTSNGHLQQVTS